MTKRSNPTFAHMAVETFHKLSKRKEDWSCKMVRFLEACTRKRRGKDLNESSMQGGEKDLLAADEEFTRMVCPKSGRCEQSLSVGRA